MNWKERYDKNFSPGDKIRVNPGPIRNMNCRKSCYECMGDKILYIKQVYDKYDHDKTLHVFEDEDYDTVKTHCTVHPDDCVKVK